MIHEDFSKRLHAATWESATPIQDQEALLAELELDGDNSLTGSLHYAQLALRFRREESLQRAQESLYPHSPNPWARFLLAEIARVLGDTEALLARIDEIKSSTAETVPHLQVEWLRLASRVSPELLDQVAHQFNAPDSLDAVLYPLRSGRGADGDTMRRYAAAVAERSKIPLNQAVAVLDFTARLTAPTNIHLTWNDPEATRRDWLEALLQRIERSKHDKIPLSIIRLFDGEAAFLQGRRTNLAGAAGLLPNGRYRDLTEDESRRAHDRFAQAALHADVCIIPDLRHLIHGPVTSVGVQQWFLDHNTSMSSSLVPGPLNFGFDLEAAGLTARLLTLCTGVIGPIDPSACGPTRDLNLRWLRIPGERGFLAPRDGAESHYHDYFDAIVNHPFQPGEVWLVAAGILGKIYCDAIRERGATAIDVGSVVDLWAGRADTRFNGRLNPWLGAQYAITSAGLSTAHSVRAEPSEQEPDREPRTTRRAGHTSPAQGSTSSPTGGRRLRIRHVINPVGAGAPESLQRAQSITLESIERALAFSRDRLDIEVVAVGEASDPIPPSWIRWEPLITRTLADFPEAQTDRRLPLLQDLLDGFWLDTGPDGIGDPGWDLGIFTNIDIGLQPTFYDVVTDLFREGYDGLSITRRTIIDSPVNAPLSRLSAQAGQPHPGHDCFVFTPSVLADVDVDLVAVGIPFVGRALLLHLEQAAQRFGLFGDLHLTFHLGNDRTWTSERNRAARGFNQRAIVRSLAKLRSRLGDVFNPNALSIAGLNRLNEDSPPVPRRGEHRSLADRVPPPDGPLLLRQPPTPLAPSVLDRRHLVFAASPGRSGTQFLANLLGTAPEVVARHEPEPQMHGEAVRRLSADGPARSYEFRRSLKLPALEAALRAVPPGGTYAETSHMFINTFADVALDAFANTRVSVLVLHRPLVDLVRSMLALGWFGTSQASHAWLLAPTSPASLFPIHPSDVQSSGDLVIGYCLDHFLRTEATRAVYERAHWIDVDITRLWGAPSSEGLFTSLGLQETDQTRLALQRTFNQRAEHKSRGADTSDNSLAVDAIRSFRSRFAREIEACDLEWYVSDRSPETQ